MKKLTLLSLCVLSSIYAFGQTGTVVISERDKDALNQGHRNDIPVVTYDDNLINISSEVELKNTHIVVTGKSGEVLYQGVKNLGQSQTTIILPQTESSEKDAIELYCDDKVYYGEFEEE